MKSYLERFLEFIKSRIFIMMAGIFVLFFAVVCKLFYLQIIHGEEYQQSLTASIMQDLTIPASRGMIYDRYGRPLATNQVAYSLKLDDSITVSFSEEERAALQDEIPAGRFGSPKEAAQMAVQLICAPDYLTGQILTLDGGWI